MRFEKIMSTDSDQEPPRKRLWPNHALRRCADWMVSGPEAQPFDIQSRLLHQSLTKTRTLVIAVVASSMTASVAAAMTAATWAYAWLLAELVFGSIRLLSMNAFVKAEASGRNGNPVNPILAGLASFTILSTGCYLCVVSGEWPLITISGIGLASLIGAVSSRNAGTPRYGFILICILTLPFAMATLSSPIPHLFIIGIQLPLYASGVIFVMIENYKVLLNLFHSEHENSRLARYDLLTGLPNRFLSVKRFDELLAGPRSASGKICSKFTVFCLDLDGFKDVNDKFGHAAGDAVLVAVAQRLRDSVRSHDFVSRIGGDEFVILLPEIYPAEATVIAERIIAGVATPIDVGPGMAVHVGISIGSASAPDDGETADELLRSADRALYEAKNRGKGLFVVDCAPTVVGLVPAAAADARIAASHGNRESGSHRFPLPLRSKSV